MPLARVLNLINGHHCFHMKLIEFNRKSMLFVTPTWQLPGKHFPKFSGDFCWKKWNFINASDMSEIFFRPTDSGLTILQYILTLVYMYSWDFETKKTCMDFGVKQTQTSIWTIPQSPPKFQIHLDSSFFFGCFLAGIHTWSLTKLAPEKLPSQ